MWRAERIFNFLTLRCVQRQTTELSGEKRARSPDLSELLNLPLKSCLVLRLRTPRLLLDAIQDLFANGAAKNLSTLVACEGFTTYPNVLNNC